MSTNYVMDAVLGTYLERELEWYDPKIYEVKYPTLMSRMIIPIRSGIGDPLEIRYSMVNKYATAKLITDYADDLPTVDVSIDSTTVKVQLLGNKAIWSIPELRTAQMAETRNPGFRALDMTKMDVMREGMERELDRLLAFGDTKTGLQGFTNHSAVNHTVVADNAATTSKEWADKDTDEILFDIAEMVETIVGNTLETEIPDTLVLPVEQLTALAFRRLSDYNNASVLSFLREKVAAYNPGFQIVGWNRLNGAGASGADRMIMFKRSPEIVEGYIVSEFERLPPQYRNLTVHVPALMSTAGVVVRYPKAIEYRDGI